MEARLFSPFDEVHGIEGFIPPEDFAIHLQPAANNFLGPK
jgi:hypothetical protein